MPHLSVVFAAVVAAATPRPAEPEVDRAIPDGTIVGRIRYEVPFKSDQEWIDFLEGRRRGAPYDEAAFRKNNPPELFGRLRKGSALHCWRIMYMSDGLRVVGYLIEPVEKPRGKKPAIIYNRGGNRDFGQLVFADLFDLARLADEGFVVVASQYRGNAGGEGREEFGGADVYDVVNLAKTLRSRDNVDPENLFMFGFSRGGMMTYLAIKEGAPINAAAVVGGPTDPASDVARRPEMLDVYRDLMPDFQTRAAEHSRDRSAVQWAEMIGVPILILHGGADWRVDPGQSLALARRLQELGKRYELHIYAGEGHALSAHRDDRRNRTV